MIRGRVDRKAATATGYAGLSRKSAPPDFRAGCGCRPGEGVLSFAGQYGWLDEERSSWRMPFLRRWAPEDRAEMRALLDEAAKPHEWASW